MRFFSLCLGLAFCVPAFANEMEVASERPLLRFHTSPESPKVGERVSLFLQVDSGFDKNEVVLAATLNTSPVNFAQSAPSLWTINFNPFTEVKTHNLHVDIFLRDAKESARRKAAITALQVEVNRLNTQIGAETDPVKKAALEKTRDDKLAYQAGLEAEQSAAKRFLKSESFSFQIQSDPANVDFPVLTSVTPDTVTTGRRVNVKITGQNFGTSPLVRIGGFNSTLVSVTSTEIVALAPNFSTPGVKTIEVIFPATGEPRKNALLSNAFFATQETLLKNVRPVAVTVGYVRGFWPAVNPVTLTATNSYDENGDSFAYNWEFLACPSGSAFVAGTPLANSATPSFMPDKAGIYRIRLQLQEAGTGVLSFSNIVTVEVK